MFGAPANQRAASEQHVLYLPVPRDDHFFFSTKKIIILTTLALAPLLG